MNIFQGWTPRLSPLQRATNAVSTCREMLQEKPGDAYWTARLDAAVMELIEASAREPECACFENAGDNPYCPKHGGQR
jgi:hypothetical protein